MRTVESAKESEILLKEDHPIPRQARVFEKHQTS